MASLGTSHPLVPYIAYDKFSAKCQAFLVTKTSYAELWHFSHAINDPKWCDAIKKEIIALEENDTWEYVVLPLGKIVVGSKGVYKIK